MVQLKELYPPLCFSPIKFEFFYHSRADIFLLFRVFPAAEIACRVFE